ncbi:hypothetical protein EYF80_018000 [Liparis tanakae]|uniref:Uncharacterized protein n=1 Tax=Liparis tanakae TaxID=230148 RepID=A0A4Z2I160_9TELE|nr:hypothetical protein EYF80_018000 [Liparis tanakae]
MRWPSHRESLECLRFVRLRLSESTESQCFLFSLCFCGLRRVASLSRGCGVIDSTIGQLHWKQRGGFGPTLTPRSPKANVLLHLTQSQYLGPVSLLNINSLGVHRGIKDTLCKAGGNNNMFAVAQSSQKADDLDGFTQSHLISQDAPCLLTVEFPHPPHTCLLVPDNRGPRALQSTPVNTGHLLSLNWCALPDIIKHRVVFLLSLSFSSSLIGLLNGLIHLLENTLLKDVMVIHSHAKALEFIGSRTGTCCLNTLSIDLQQGSRPLTTYTAQQTTTHGMTREPGVQCWQGKEQTAEPPVDPSSSVPPGVRAALAGLEREEGSWSSEPSTGIVMQLQTEAVKGLVQMST